MKKVVKDEHEEMAIQAEVDKRLVLSAEQLLAQKKPVDCSDKFFLNHAKSRLIPHGISLPNRSEIEQKVREEREQSNSLQPQNGNSLYIELKSTPEKISFLSVEPDALTSRRTTDKGDLRKIANSILSREIAESTQLEYAKVNIKLQSYLETGKNWFDYCTEHQVSKSHANECRAAQLRLLAERIKKILRDLDSDEFDADEKRELRATASNYAEQIVNPPKYTPDPDRKKTQKPHGKKLSVRGLKFGWQDSIIAKMRRQRDKIALAVIAATGARPGEAHNTLKLIRIDCNILDITILGEKVSQSTGGGQELRVLRFKLDALPPLTRRTLEVAIGDKSEIIVPRDPGTIEAFEKRVLRACKRDGLNEQSAYTFRHSTGTVWKAEKINGGTISAGLGHRSSKSRRRYGHHALSTGGPVALVSATATHPVRDRDDVRTPPENNNPRKLIVIKLSPDKE